MLRAYDKEVSSRARKLPGKRDHPQVLRELAALRQAFAWLYQDDDLQRQAEHLVEEWTRDFEYNPNRIAIRKAWSSVLSDAPWESEWDISVGATLATRKARWERLSGRYRIKMPSVFRAYRGVKGIPFVQAVVSAWQQDAERLEVRQRELASWSLNPSVAVRFASDPRASVVYAADIPFELTLADKWVDGGRFIAPYYWQYEVIAGSSLPNGLLALAKLTRVCYQNTWFTYDERARLIERLRRR